jgi:hypothetical protein
MTLSDVRPTDTDTAVAAAGDSGKEAMRTLYQQWYNATVSGLRLDESSFQLLQPNSPLGATSDQLWAYFNMIPPLSLVGNLELDGMNQFYSDYRAVISVLRSQGGDQFRQDTGDYYQPWMTYVSSLSPVPTSDQLPSVFFSWAQIHAPSVATAGRNDLLAMSNDPIGLAQQAVMNQTGFLNGVPNFIKTILDLRTAITQGPSGSFSFDSGTESSDTSKAWAQGATGGFYDFFEAGGESDWERTQTKTAESRITVDVQYDHVITFGNTPGSWYSSGAMGVGYGTEDNTVWVPGATPNWNSTFGPDGNMQRVIGSLVVVDGISITMHSDASFSSDEQEKVHAKAEAGFFPFFAVEASGGYESRITFDDHGEMDVSATSPKGNPVVIGANVLTAQQVWG